MVAKKMHSLIEITSRRLNKLSLNGEEHNRFCLNEKHNSS
jgi:hypothetical protein